MLRAAVALSVHDGVVAVDKGAAHDDVRGAVGEFLRRGASQQGGGGREEHETASHGVLGKVATPRGWDCPLLKKI